jgi:hypothetical protein
MFGGTTFFDHLTFQEMNVSRTLPKQEPVILLKIMKNRLKVPLAAALISAGNNGCNDILG